jgi:mono/diheme cytochrome c family protein
MRPMVTDSVKILFLIVWVLSCGESETTGSYSNQRTFASSGQAATGDATANGNATPAAPPSLQDQALAILKTNCVKCHGAGATQGGFGVVGNPDAMIATNRYLVKGNPQGSLIFTKLRPTGNMPPAGPISAGDVETIKLWIESL